MNKGIHHSFNTNLQWQEIVDESHRLLTSQGFIVGREGLINIDLFDMSSDTPVTQFPPAINTAYEKTRT